MNRLKAIVEDEDLEEHFIYYVGVRHMHTHWERFLDPALPFDWQILELFYREMRLGTYQDLKLALRKGHHIKSSDPDFKGLLEAAIAIIVQKHGMDTIIATAKEFLYVVTREKSVEDEVTVDYSAPCLHCPTCKGISVSLTYEDVPLSIWNTSSIAEEEFYGFCIPCGHFFPARNSQS